MWCMHDIYWCGVKQESDCLHHGSGGVGLDADSKFTKQDRMRSQKYQSPHTSDIYILLRSESQNGMCTKLHTVAASNKGDHPTRSLYYCLFVPQIYMGVVLRHITFVVDHTFNATPTEKLQHFQIWKFWYIFRVLGIYIFDLAYVKNLAYIWYILVEGFG